MDMSDQTKTNVMSRRKLLLSMGMASAALVTGGLTLGAEPADAKKKNQEIEAPDLLQVPDIAALRATTGSFDGQQVYVVSHSSGWVESAITGRGPTGGGMFTRVPVSELSSPVDNNGTIIIVNSAVAWVRSDTTECRVEDFGAIPDGVANNDAAILAAIASIRRNPTEILQDIGGDPITAYTSGRVVFGRGVYVVSPDLLLITQDMGLQLVGQGYRGSNNAIPGTSVLLFSGVSNGFGIRFFGSGSRSALIQDMDLCYADSGFTGDLIDSHNSPGLKLNRVYIGTAGTTKETRIRTARSGIRATTDEFNHFENVTFDGLVDGWWSDDTRDSNPFGGTLTTFDTCVFYDISNYMIRHDGNKTRNALSIQNSAFNPIQANCQRSIKVDNIDGFHLDTSVFAGSTTHFAEIEWVRITNATGTINGNSFNDFSKAGTFAGMLEIKGNVVYCTDGFTLLGGPITASNNEFSKAAAGYRVAPLYPITMTLGPDLFKANVSSSYYLTPDSLDVFGKIIYAQEQDASTNKFINECTRVMITSASGHTVSVYDTNYEISILNTGRDFLFAVNGDQTVTLPIPVAGTEIGVMVIGSGTKTITRPGGVAILTGTGSTITYLSTDKQGAYVRFRALGTSNWVAISKTDGWEAL